MKNFFQFASWFLLMFAVATIIVGTFFVPLQRTTIGYTNEALDLTWWLVLFALQFMILGRQEK